MQNLEQIRAVNALEATKAADRKPLDRKAVNKLPAMIINNGLLATAAFCEAEGGGDNRKDMKEALDATAKHLAKRHFVSDNTTSTRQLIDDLAKRDSHQLQLATDEALAYIAYLKRFAKKGQNGSEE